MKVLEDICEATILKLQFDPSEKTLAIRLKLSNSNENCELTATGVEEFAAWDFKLHNIVDQVHIYSGEECAHPEIQSLIWGAILGRAHSKLDGNSLLFESLNNLLHKGQLKLASLDAVFGAEFLVIAKNFEFSRSDGIKFDASL